MSNFETSFTQEAEIMAHHILNEVLPLVISLRMQIELLNETSLRTYCANFNHIGRPAPEGELGFFDFPLRKREYLRVLFDGKGRVKLEYTPTLKSNAHDFEGRTIEIPDFIRKGIQDAFMKLQKR